MDMKHIRCLVVGDQEVPKTCFLICYTTKAYPGEYIPTVFDNYSTNITFEGQAVDLQLLNTAGQEEYKKLRPLSYPKIDVFMLCFSLVSPASHENIEKVWVPEINEHCPNKPFILVGLESDLREEIEQNVEEFRSKGKEPVSTAKGMEMKNKIKACAYFECSLRKMQNITEAFEEAIRFALNPPSNNNQTSGGGCEVI